MYVGKDKFIFFLIAFLVSVWLLIVFLDAHNGWAALIFGLAAVFYLVLYAFLTRKPNDSSDDREDHE